MNINKKYLDFIESARQNDYVIAVILAGSYAKGLQTSSSDIDVYIIVSDNTPSDDIKNLKIHVTDVTNGQVDLSTNGIQKLSYFREYATIGSIFDWDRYNLVHTIVEFDKSNGQIDEILSKKTTLSAAEVKSTLDTYLGPFVNMTYRSVSSILKGDQSAARLDAAQAIKPLINCLFSFKSRVTPFNKYLSWELNYKPLGYEIDDNLVDQLGKFASADLATQRMFFNLIKEAALNANADELYSAWGNKLNIVQES